MVSLIVVVLLFAPPVRDGLESWMTTHVTVQLTGLVFAGWCLGIALRRPLSGVCRLCNQYGLCGLTIGLFTALFWMLPRSLDEAIVNMPIEIAKFLTVPLLVGLPLSLSWPSLNPILRGFLKATLISKLAVLGWIYAVIPSRLCTNYLLSDQMLLGEILCILAGVLAIAWSLPWFLTEDSTADAR
jgi:hypothetical protein